MAERPEDTAPEAQATGRRMTAGRLILIVAAALGLGAAVGFAGVYGIAGGERNANAGAVAGAPAASADEAGLTDGRCARASEVARTLAPFAKGEVAAFAPTLTPRRVPELAFQDGAGKPVTLADVGGGGLKLVNIWATWCAPCRKEMPALDRLQAELGAKGGDGQPGFEVVALNVDTRDADKPRTFLNEIGVRNLAYYADPKADSFQRLRAVGRGFGLPTTLLVDAKGCEIGHMSGPAEWASEDALALLQAALKASAAVGSGATAASGG